MKKLSTIRQFAVILLALMMLFAAAGCDDVSDAANSIAAEATEDATVKSVREGHPRSEEYKDITFDEAFGSFFEYPTWRHFTGTRTEAEEDGEAEPAAEEEVEVVEFTGNCMYQNVKVKVLIQFEVKEDGTFEAVYCSLNDVPQNMLVMSSLIQKAFDTAYEKRYGQLPPDNQDDSVDFSWEFDDESTEPDTTELYEVDPEEGEVYDCDLTGCINTQGGTVSGYKTSYVVDGGKRAKVRKSLGNGWHINAVRFCYAKGILWYELYDSDDGDYYGWVDSDYIDFD